MADTDIARQRLRNQRLAGNPLSTAADVIRWFGAVQAQDYRSAKWAVAQRTPDLTDAGFDRLFLDGAVLRTHVLRPTWHFVLPEDIRWMLKLTAPRVQAAMGYYARQLELDDVLLRRGSAVLATALGDGQQLTRAEVAQLFRLRGMEVDGQRLGHILMHAELDAVVCSGGLRGKQLTYALLDDRAAPGRTLERDEAVAELARRYFTSHGPATPQDFSWWSGLTVADARAGIGMLGPALMRDVVDGKTYWFVAEGSAAGTNSKSIHLLPNYDEHIVAYRDHRPSFDTSVLSRLRPEYGSLMGHTLVRNGRVIGGWRRSLQQGTLAVTTTPLAPLGKADRAALAATAERYRKFLGADLVTVTA